MRLLNKQPVEYIAHNGKATTDRPTKLDVPVELQFKRMPAQFEGFITKITADRAVVINAQGAEAVFALVLKPEMLGLQATCRAKY